MGSLCQTFPTTLCFSVCPQLWFVVPMRLNWYERCGTGPNSAGGHASVLFIEEVQVCVCVTCVKTSVTLYGRH